MSAIPDTKMLCGDQFCVGSTGPCWPKVPTFGCRADMSPTCRRHCHCQPSSSSVSSSLSSSSSSSSSSHQHLLNHLLFQLFVVYCYVLSVPMITNKENDDIVCGLHMQWMGIWNHWQPVTIALVDPDFDSRLKSWVTLLAYTNHTIMQWLRLHTHPKLLAHQCRAHIWCMNHFICSGWAYGTISNPLPSPMLTHILKVVLHSPGSH
jgi:hypothetical protein